MPKSATPRDLPLGAPVLAVTRGASVESVHRGSIAVVDAAGRLLASFGDPLVPVFLRSAAKPFQLVPFLAAGGERKFRLTTEEIALAAASHAGEPSHTAAAERMLAKGAFTPEDLRCGAHAPASERAARALALRGEEPSALHNNCSGKHSAMLLACRLFGEDPATYTAPKHPLQKRILSLLSRMTDVDEARIGIAVDGCSAPVFRMPLASLALGYARLAAERAPRESARERDARKRIFRAMTAAPEMVSGAGRFTTELIAAYAGRLVGKEGADGVYAVSVASSIARAPAGGPVGIALKIEDGS
ncbi:MAG TPA: asparaginase, partial [Thermoanaerobaculia bacterium]|nr:asparaginase [Thermoanaerobaculia bacterium]